MNERQVDLGLGRGLKPGALAVLKDGEEDINKEGSSKLNRKISLDDRKSRRRTTLGMIELKKTVVKSDKVAEGLSKSMEISLQFQLQAALQEAEALRQELDSYRKQLDSKHSAIRILRQQMSTTAVQLDDLHTRSVHMRKDMNTEINRLQFELEYNQNILMESQQTWSQRFDRVCQENAKQQSAINAKNEEIRQLTEERKALARDREELVALLDADKRAQWFASESSIAVRAANSAALSPTCSCSSSIPSSRPTSCDSVVTLPFDADSRGSGSIELAVLGACSCKGKSPCRCAHAAARLKREVIRARELAVEARQRADDAYVVVDAYRNAFEEQLSRNRSLTMRMGDLATNSAPAPRGSRIKALVSWVSRQLQDLGLSGEAGDQRGMDDGPQRRQINSGRLCRNFSIRRASTVEDVGLATTCNGGKKLSSSSWSISESVVSTGVLGIEEEDVDDGGGVDHGCAAGDICGDDEGNEEKAQYRHTAADCERIVDLSEDELMRILLEKLCERTESVAHQRITARVLKRPGASSHDTVVCGTHPSASSGVFSAASSDLPSSSSQTVE